MENFYYLNYKEVNERLDALVNNPNTKIKVKKEKPIGYTDYALPINHYTMGHGNKHVIVTGSYHSAEIITTIFVVHLMEDLDRNADSFILEEYTIDFIPIVNPEGYLITTSMQDLYLSKGKTEEEKIALAKKYFSTYRQDAINTTSANKVLQNPNASLEERGSALKVLRGKKGYQRLFDEVDKEEYLKDYPLLKDAVLDILAKNNYPIGVCAAWSANGHGVDLSQNAPFNVNIPKYLESKAPLYSATAYSNIRKDVPGPINAICRDLNHFTFESENLSLLQFLAELNKEAQIVAFLNYHSVMGKIYQRPAYEEEIINLYDIDIERKIIENYTGSRIMREENAYDIIEREDSYSYINEYFRLRYGINIQVELSRMGSNPIGPLADPQTFSNITLKPNIQAFKKLLQNLEFIKEYATFIKRIIRSLNDKRKWQQKEPLNPEETYRIIDSICKNNPTLYTKVREEIKKLNSFNFHIIAHFLTLIEKSILNGQEELENNPIKEQVLGIVSSEDRFVINYSNFIIGFINRLNDSRIRENKPLLEQCQIEGIIDNICLDYPEIFATLKRELQEENPNQERIEALYHSLEEVLNHQIKMNNLMR